jgi:hypothetical protein
LQRCTDRCGIGVRCSTATADTFRRTIRRFDLRWALWDPGILSTLASHGTSHIIVNADGDENGRLKRYVSGQPGVMLVCTDAIQSIYRLTERSAAEPIERGRSSNVGIGRAERET